MLLITLLLSLIASLFYIKFFQDFTLLYTLIVLVGLYIPFSGKLQEIIEKYFISNAPVDANKLPSRAEHDIKRSMTYPEPVANTWYHFCDSKELSHGKVIEVRALGRVFALWRTKDGKPVCQDAFCLHLGANLAVGGKVVDNCLECPFHKWKFASNGEVVEIPYIKDPKSCSTTKKLKTYPCKDWCGLVCVYFHADDADPEFDLPTYVENELKDGNWAPHLNLNIGHKTLSPVDWVDQAGDHAHFHTLHADFLIPWTLIPLPEWLLNLFPLGICHSLVTYRGDDNEWKKRVKETGYGAVDKHLIFFTDQAGITWDKKPLDFTLSETIELFVGPAMMVFSIPFTIGAFKVFVTTTPVEGGSVMRVRTWVDERVRNNFFKRIVAWILTGISASQLRNDIDIMCNKIRLKKPILQPFDGPYNRTNSWLKQFYSDGSLKKCDKYSNDW